MTTADTLNGLATSITDLAETLRLGTPDPADQIRLLSELARYGRSPDVTTDPVGIIGYRAAGASNVWASCTRSTSGSFIDGAGVFRLLPANRVRPLYAGPYCIGYLNETASSNLQVYSTSIVPGTGYSTGSNTVDGGAVLAPDGSLTARRIVSGAGGPGNVYLSRGSRVTVSPSTTYTVSCYYRAAVGTPNTGLTVDEVTAGNVTTRTGTRNLGAAGVNRNGWTRVSRTFTTRSDTAQLQVYYADNHQPGTAVDVWGTQIEPDGLSSLIPTTSATVSRAADNVSPSAVSAPLLVNAAQSRAADGMAALCRRAALCSLALACADYYPPSATEAQRTLAAVLALYDAEILSSADAGDDAAYSALRAMRTAVSRDLTERAINLPEIVHVSRAVSQPSLVQAYRMYGDAGREAELTRRVDPPHPLFFPKEFDALSS
ncbi:hypothetical protein [Roseicella sp. DB1501]|uniref:phage head spike fiber domain-containing protein n=1 Tax=Roseicella sp. DB1501 TaxID=2730925 RepID=UPI001491E17D|nr:hypothetical protein [Roseicella sp. DB1501]NOG69817.1 hypothetical protein [Roseicella sp. DB1501]